MTASQNSTHALLIGNGSLPSKALLEQYALNASIILVLDSAIVALSKSFPELRIDVLLGDFDRNFQASTYKQQYPNIKIVHTPDQEKADLEKGIEYLVVEGYRKIIGLGLTGKRMDHTLSNMSILAKFHPEIELTLIDDYSHIICISDNFEMYYPKNTIISLIPMGKVEGITTQNLYYPLINGSLELGQQTGSSNKVAADGNISIQLKKGKLLVMECKD